MTLFRATLFCLGFAAGACLYASYWSVEHQKPISPQLRMGIIAPLSMAAFFMVLQWSLYP